MTSTKEHILDAIRKNKPQGTQFPYPKIPLFPKNNQDILQEFKDNLVANAGTWYDINSIEEGNNKIKELHPQAKVICSAAVEFQGNKDLSPLTDSHQLENVDVGIIRAQFGVSENGMVWMTEKDMIVTSLGFLSQHLIILLKPQEIVRDMYEAYAKINLQESNYGCFMLGPSATGDIGAVMVRGAQGARSLSVFFM